MKVFRVCVLKLPIFYVKTVKKKCSLFTKWTGSQYQDSFGTRKLAMGNLGTCTRFYFLLLVCVIY